MKKTCLIIAIIVVLVAVTVITANHFTVFNEVDLRGKSVITSDISIIGKYVFYHQDNLMSASTKAKNIETDEEKLFSWMCVHHVQLNGNRFYFSAPVSLSPDSRVCTRGMSGIIPKRIDHTAAYNVKIADDVLYFQKTAYIGDADYSEGDNLYSINLISQEKEKVLGIEIKDYEVSGDYIYYSVALEDNFKKYSKILSDVIYKYSLSKKNSEKILTDKIQKFRLVEDTIVYMQFITDAALDEERADLILFNSGTNDTMKIAEDIRAFEVFDDNICYVSNENAEVMNIFNYKSGETLSRNVGSIDCGKSFVLYENAIYYYNTDGELCHA